jgi:hypothetical protein
MHELVRCGGICAALDLDDDRLLSVGVAKDRVRPLTTNPWLCHYGEARDVPKNAKGLRLERALDIHYFSLIHSSCEYTRNGEFTPVSLVRS